MLKGIGIILVVLGHTTHNDELSSWIYHFHMPLFFFLSGVFFSPTIQGLVKRVRQISKLLGMETEAVRESIVWSLLMSCLIIVILVPVCMFINRKCKWVLGKS